MLKILFETATKTAVMLIISCLQNIKILSFEAMVFKILKDALNRVVGWLEDFRRIVSRGTKAYGWDALRRGLSKGS